jgi:antitoxin StbD
MAVVEQGDGFPVAVLNRNQPVFYCVPADAYEIMMDKLEDFELAQLVKERQNQPEIKVSISDL